MPSLKAPFPYFGGKSTVASVVWDRLGDVANYLEPFAGSLAVMLNRPTQHKTETVNDVCSYLTNFWRSIQRDPDAVAEHADYPVSELDLHARHRYLVGSYPEDDVIEVPAHVAEDRRADWIDGYRTAQGPRSGRDAERFRERMRTDPDYYDPKFAGWWVWGICQWIGGGWCSVQKSEYKRRPNANGRGVDAKGLSQQMPETDSRGKNATGISHQKRRPMLSSIISAGGRPQLGDAFDIGRGVHAGRSSGTCAERRARLVEWFRALADRLRLVRICCGSWERICDSPTTTTRLGLTGVFLDPPYSAEAGRDNTLYAHESLTVAHEVREWCLRWGNNPQMRIALCGYVGEGHEALTQHGWDEVAWKPNGGYGNRSDKGKENAGKERIWFSPHCLNGRSLFDDHE